MHFWILTFFWGTFVLVNCAKLPSLYWLFVLIPVIFLKIFAFQKIAKVLTHFLAFMMGFGWALIYAHCIVAWSLPHTLEGKNLIVVGHIASIPHKKPHSVSFEFDISKISNAGLKKSVKLQLGWYGAYPKLIAGDKWQLQVRIKRPHAILNPGCRDSEKNLLAKRIRATGYVVSATNPEFNYKLSSHLYSYPLTRLRQYILERMWEILSFTSTCPVIIALVTGAQHEITQKQWEVMRSTGTSYLVAISGLHIGLVASVFLGFIQFLWGQSKGLLLILPKREAGIIGGLFAGFLYGAISGLSIPTQRALVMLSAFSLISLIRRNSQSFNAWMWSLFVVLLINPLAQLEIGFWLSFIAVAAIIYVSFWRIGGQTNHLEKFWQMQLAVTIALLPFGLLFFQQFSVTALVANLVAMPVVCLIVVPMSLCGAMALLCSDYIGSLILLVSTKLFNLVWLWLELFTNVSFGNWFCPIYNWPIFLAAVVGVLLLLAPRGFPSRYLGVIWFLPLFFYTPPRPKPHEIWFSVLDVGQGLASVIQTSNHVLLYDTGPGFFEHDLASSVIIPYLRTQGIKAIDLMVVSHGDLDHSGGAKSILREFKVNKVLTSDRGKLAPYFSELCFAGQRWRWDGVEFQMLFPPFGSEINGNNGSCVLKVTTGKNSILLPGDIEKTSENFLTQNSPIDLKSTILVAPHHGSSTSSTKNFITSVFPNYVLFPVGYKNRFHLPAKSVLSRYSSIGASLFNLSQTGAITFKFNDKSQIKSPNLYRREYQHFWQQSDNSGIYTINLKN